MHHITSLKSVSKELARGLTVLKNVLKQQIFLLPSLMSRSIWQPGISVSLAKNRVALL